MRSILLFSAVACLSLSFANGQQTVEEILQTILNSSYDKRVRPGGNGPINVTTNFYVRSMSLNDMNRELTVQLTYRQQWNDSRLRYASNRRIKYVTLSDGKEIWTPDIFPGNGVTSHTHDLLTPNSYVRISPDGAVLYSVRITFTLSCLMDFSNFPMDTQSCSIRLASYGYTEEDIVMNWKKRDPIQISSSLYFDVWDLRSFYTDRCDSHTNTGVYSCLKAVFTLERNFKHYLVMVYIPLAMLVILSWASFWFHHDAVTGRVLIGLSTLLVAAVQTYEVNSALPKTSYTKAIDVYTGVSLTFIFLALLEFCTVNYCSRVYNANKAGNPQVSLGCWENIKKAPFYEKIDMLARIVFPSAYVVFIVVYAICYGG